MGMEKTTNETPRRVVTLILEYYGLSEHCGLFQFRIALRNFKIFGRTNLI
jgi:hypothetical protein